MTNSCNRGIFMNAWLKALEDFYFGVCGRASNGETVFLTVLCVLLGALALSRVATGLGSIGAFYTTAVLLVPIGLFLICAGMVLPVLLGRLEWWMPVAAGTLSGLVLVLPLTMAMMKGRYVASLIAWVVALLTIGAVLKLEAPCRDRIDQVISKGKVLEHRFEGIGK